MRPADKPAAPEIDVAALVARYAPIGQQHRRQTRVRRSLIAVAIPAVAGLGWVVAANMAGSVPDGSGGERSQVSALQAQLRADTAAVQAERQRWESQRQEYDAQNAVLRARLAELDSARDALRLQQQKVEQQRLALETASRKMKSPGKDETARQREVSFQSELVARELKVLTTQRADLAQQHAALESQRRELQQLMERYDAATRENRAPPSSAGPQTEAARDPQASARQAPVRPEAAAPPLLMASSQPVPAETLGGMRGGMQISGMDVTFGLTHSGSINGVEQYSTSVYVDDLSGLGEVMAGGLGSQAILIQNGAGNYVGVDALTGQMSAMIQNTLDSQTIQTKTIIDVSVGNFAGFAAGVGAVNAITESLTLQQP